MEALAALAEVSPAPWARRLGERLSPAASGDAHAVHALRTAAARLRAWLALARRAALDDDLRALRRHTAGLRDLQVHLARRPPRIVAERLRLRAATARARLPGVLLDARADALADALARAAPISRIDAARALPALLQRATARAQRVARHPGSESAQHALRRALRAARYAVEWTAPWPKPLLALQHALGEVQDRRVALEHLGGLPLSGAVGRYRRRLQRELREKLGAAARSTLERLPDLNRLQAAARRAAQTTNLLLLSPRIG